jgi:hypothetical protein
MKRIFWGFCINQFLMSPLHYLSDFGFEFTDTRLGESESQRLPDSPSRGVEFLHEFEAKIGQLER